MYADDLVIMSPSVAGLYKLIHICESFGLSHDIHVNPPSFVRSLRHFGMAQNLRPGDENLRHLTVTSIFKKMRMFFDNQ